MDTYLVSFRIADDGNYTDRWSSTVSAIRAEAGGKTWEEATSLIVLRSSKSPDALARDIYLSANFDVTRDMLLVVNASKCSYATRGKIEYPATLSSFFTSSTSPVARALMGKAP